MNALPEPKDMAPRQRGSRTSCHLHRMFGASTRCFPHAASLAGSRLATWGLVLGLALGAALPGCGGSGGVDTGGTGHAAPTNVVVGPITGFGSVVVSGVRFDERQATIVDDDGAALAAGALQLGMGSTVEAGDITPAAPGASTGTATAYRIRISHYLLGPVSAVDTATCSVVVLGQRVVAVAATVVDSSLPATAAACRLAGLSINGPDQALMVYGVWDAAQSRVVASRVELRQQASAYVLRGVVQNYNLAERKLTLGGQPISLAELAATQLPASLADGSLVRLRLRPVQVGNRWVALDFQGGEPALPAGAAGSIEGRVSQITAAQQFSVNGLAVDAQSAVFTPGHAGLVLGAKVEVKGLVVGGTMVARTVSIDVEQGDNEDKVIEIEGSITALDTTARTFVVRGTTVGYAGNPQWEGGTLGDLAVGRKVAVKGVLSSDGRVLVATKIHIEL